MCLYYSQRFLTGEDGTYMSAPPSAPDVFPETPSQRAPQSTAPSPPPSSLLPKPPIASPIAAHAPDAGVHPDLMVPTDAPYVWYTVGSSRPARKRRFRHIGTRSTTEHLLILFVFFFLLYFWFLKFFNLLIF